MFFASTRINIDNKINNWNLIVRKQKYLKVEDVRLVVLEDFFSSLYELD